MAAVKKGNWVHGEVIFESLDVRLDVQIQKAPCWLGKTNNQLAVSENTQFHKATPSADPYRPTQ